MPERPKGQGRNPKGKKCPMDSRCTNQKDKCTEPRNDSQGQEMTVPARNAGLAEMIKLAARNAGPTPPIHKGFMVYRAPPPWPHVLPEVHGCKKAKK